MNWDPISKDGKRDERALEELAKNVPLWLAHPEATAAGVLSQFRVGTNKAHQSKLDLILLEKFDSGLCATIVESKPAWESRAEGQALYYWYEVIRDAEQISVEDGMARAARKRIRVFPLQALGGATEIGRALVSPEIATLIGSGKKRARKFELTVDWGKLLQLQKISGRDKRFAAFTKEFGKCRERSEGDRVEYRRFSAKVWIAEGTTDGGGGGRPFAATVGCITWVAGQKPTKVPLEGLEVLGPWEKAIDAIRSADARSCVRRGGILATDAVHRWAFLVHAPALTEGIRS